MRYTISVLPKSRDEPTDLLLNDMLIDFASGDVVVLAQADVEVSLVVPQIQIRLSTIVQHIHLACNRSVCPDTRKEADIPCSVGAIVPASMFMYGSILIAVTFSPVVLSRSPVLEARLNQYYG